MTVTRRRSRAAHDPRAARARVDRGARGLPVHARARAHRDVLLVLLRQLSRAGQVAALRRSRRGARRVGQHRAADGAVGVAAAVRAVSAVCDRGSLVVVAAGIGPQGAVADRGRDPRAWPAAPTSAACRALQMAAQVLGDIRKKKSEEQRPLKTPVARVVVRAPEDKLELLPDIEQDLRAVGPDSADRDARRPKRCRSTWSWHRRRARLDGRE